jgi:hypothetical protein
MPKQRPGRSNGKRTREFIAAIRQAGGEVELTAKGHLRVTGPAGVTVVGSRHGPTDRRAQLNALSELRRRTGLHVRRV